MSKIEWCDEWYEVLKTRRAAFKLSLRDVERRSGVSNAYISQLENGHIKEPSFIKLMRLFKLYAINPFSVLKQG